MVLKISKPVFLLFLVGVLFGTLCAGELVNANVLRVVDLGSQIVKDTYTVSIHNRGATPDSAYYFAIENYEHLAYFGAKDKKADAVLPYSIEDKQGTKVAIVKLLTPLASDEKITLVFSLYYTHALQPYPKEIGQNDPQLFLYTGNLYLYSLYPTLKFKASIVLPSDKFESYSPNPGLSISGNKLTFGPTTETLIPLSKKDFQVHYTNNSPFITVERLLRTLEVSHWGSNLAVEEFYDIQHTGAKLKGQFSRLEYDRSAMNHANTQVVKEFQLNLPIGATDVYYRDIIGNISTSHYRSTPFEASLEVTPRYPLFGGWKSKWYHGYNLPLSQALQHKDSTYILNFLFVAPFEEAVIDDFTLRVTLPEGATDIKFESEFDLGVSISLEKIQTYLDTHGRPVLVVTKKNVIGNSHQVPVQVTYKLPTTLLLQEPFLLISFFFSLFLIAMVLVRIDLSISKNTEKERKDLSRSYWSDVIEKEEEKKDLYKTLENALNVVKETKNQTSYDSKRKEVEQALNEKNDGLKTLQEHLTKKNEKTMAENIDQLLSISKEKWSKTTKLHNELISVYIGKSPKKQAQSSVDEQLKAIQNLDKKVESILE